MDLIQGLAKRQETGIKGHQIATEVKKLKNYFAIKSTFLAEFSLSFIGISVTYNPTGHDNC